MYLFWTTSTVRYIPSENSNYIIMQQTVKWQLVYVVLPTDDRLSEKTNIGAV